MRLDQERKIRMAARVARTEKKVSIQSTTMTTRERFSRRSLRADPKTMIMVPRVAALKMS